MQENRKESVVKKPKRLLVPAVFLILGLVAISGCGIAQSDYDALAGQKDALEIERNALQADYDAVKAELDEMKQTCPPREFSSRTELEDWLYQNDVSEKPEAAFVDAWFAKALEIQDDALLDGYLVSADYDYYEVDDTYSVFCTTVIDGYVWWWDPETDDVISDTTLGKVR